MAAASTALIKDEGRGDFLLSGDRYLRLAPVVQRCQRLSTAKST